MTAAGAEPRSEAGTIPYCDLVMKGGITSGLVYPKAVCRIGEAYRFRNIGGTSAGAIAAALSAAAALGERRIAAGDATTGGFEALKETAKQLTGEGVIYSLFQPVRKARGAFRLLVKFTGNPNVGLIRLAFGAALLAPLSFILTLGVLELIGWAIAGARGAIAVFIPSLPLALCVAVISAALSTARAIRSNFLGMCSGFGQGTKDKPDLSQWMHEQIQLLAGFGENDAPVTFGDLWKAPLYDGEKPFAKGEKALNLEVITTDVSHSEPRTLPFPRGGALWFRKDEMERFFPKAVVEAMTAAESDGRIEKGGIGYWPFPTAEKLPILVAARMSLSFPLLISAVPLYEKHFLPKAAAAEDERIHPDEAAQSSATLSQTMDELTISSAKHQRKAAEFEMRKCWFTDGGVSSNFPLHLFDAPMPRWPTFAIDLVYPPSGTEPSKNPIFLPKKNNQGWRPRYTSVARPAAINEIGSFLTAIISTMQNWRDLLLGRAPGQRDRIVQVEILEEEGGMNLDMHGPVPTNLANKGEAAGTELVTAFDFENHFWIRYRNLQASLERFGIRLHTAMKASPEGAEDAYGTAMKGEGTPPSYPFTGEQTSEAVHRLDDLLQEVATWEDSTVTLTKGAPNPPPHLRIVPIF